jgi:hypothetical protein
VRFSEKPTGGQTRDTAGIFVAFSKLFDFLRPSALSAHASAHTVTLTMDAPLLILLTPTGVPPAQNGVLPDARGERR